MCLRKALKCVSPVRFRTNWLALLFGLTLSGCSNVEPRSNSNHVPRQTDKPNCSHSSNAEAHQTVRLDDLYSLNIRRDRDEHEVLVELTFADAVVKRYAVANALITKVSIESVDLDRSNGETEYLISIPDRSSTYGAQTGIIVHWLDGWKFLLVPDDWFAVIRATEGGWDLLECQRIQQKHFELVRGILRETITGTSTP
jgi:hypothetical protein